MGDAVLGDRGEDRRRLDPAQADMGPGDRSHCPGIGPAVAVEHRQGPQIDRIAVEPNGDRVAERVQKGAAMVIDDALGIAGGAGSVVERDRRPLVLGAGPFGGRIALAEKGLVFGAAERRAVGKVVDLDERQRAAELGQRRRDDRGEFSIGDQQLRLAMRQDKGDRARVETVIERVQHRPRHRHAVMRFEQCRHIRRQYRDRVARPDTAAAQRIGEPPAAIVKLAIGEAGFAMHDRELVRIDHGRARQKTTAASAQ